MVLSLAKTEGNQGLGAAAAHCRNINSRMSGIGSAIKLLAIVAGRVQSGLVARSYHYRRTPPVCHGSGFLSGCIPFLPTLVPRLCPALPGNPLPSRLCLARRSLWHSAFPGRAWERGAQKRECTQSSKPRIPRKPGLRRLSPGHTLIEFLQSGRPLFSGFLQAKLAQLF